MDWYEKLSNYFPEEEMKHAGQMKELLESDIPYHKVETDDYVVMYADFPTFLFIDYVIVTSSRRGSGLGSKILQAFKKKHKTVILEVEPADKSEPDTVKRVRFYERNGFQKAEHILYTRTDDDGEEFSMDIYYWSPDEIHEREVMRNMATICREIHNFKTHKYYGRIIADPSEVLEWDAESDPFDQPQETP